MREQSPKFKVSEAKSRSELHARIILAVRLSDHHVVHDRRSSTPLGWMKRGPLEPTAVLPISIGLVQSNWDKGYDWLMEVSHPTSKKYGLHWEASDIASAFAPSRRCKGVAESAGVALERVEKSVSEGWLKFTATQHNACEEYSVPSWKDKIDFVTLSVHFDVKLRARDEDSLKERELQPGHGKRPGKPENFWGPKLKNLDSITPWCLRALYKFSPGPTKNPKNNFGIVEYILQAYTPSDLELFFRNFSTRQVGIAQRSTRLTAALSNRQHVFNCNGELDLELEYAMTPVYPQKVTLLQEGGDNLTQDSAYPARMEATRARRPAESTDLQKSPAHLAGLDAPYQNGALVAGAASRRFPPCVHTSQQSAVKGFSASHPPPYTSAQYNNSQQTRGFPDISANGANYVIAIDAPTLGSIFVLVNKARFNVRKGSIGFINPVVYGHSEVFNNITEGGNQGCATAGFSATTGWDTVTVLGTPNFPNPLKLFLSLA
ncbi:Pro-kumamolisin, activation domain-domain-containing protein [Clohesyomyces aquaticus]|uniref:Pro-kumamolisin, activation domain-domain-containing protein n=1 Tax=Clohesyomyces aquaticus TaxID=1231657 RepID=A0A1Y1YM00_9PLEO|nr:Pro-kumamolisin, activation domain-domain-containing protein [Clohesyomyces aquaticus]